MIASVLEYDSYAFDAQNSHETLIGVQNYYRMLLDAILNKWVNLFFYEPVFNQRSEILLFRNSNYPENLSNF